MKMRCASGKTTTLHFAAMCQATDVDDATVLGRADSFDGEGDNLSLRASHVRCLGRRRNLPNDPGYFLPIYSFHAVGADGYCSPSRIKIKKRGFKCVSMTWRAMGLACSPRHRMPVNSITEGSKSIG